MLTVVWLPPTWARRRTSRVLGLRPARAGALPSARSAVAGAPSTSSGVGRHRAALHVALTVSRRVTNHVEARRVGNVVPEPRCVRPATTERGVERRGARQRGYVPKVVGTFTRRKRIAPPPEP